MEWFILHFFIENHSYNYIMFVWKYYLFFIYFEIMKKFWLLIVAWIAIILSWCSDKEACAWGSACTLYNEKSAEETQVITETNFFWNRENSAKWAVAMQKPSIDEMENYDAILNGYTKDWTKDYTLTSEDVRILNQCLNSEWAKDFKEFNVYWGYWKGHSHYVNNFSKDEVKEWNTLTLTWTYKFDDSKLALTAFMYHLFKTLRKFSVNSSV